MPYKKIKCPSKLSYPFFKALCTHNTWVLIGASLYKGQKRSQKNKKQKKKKTKNKILERILYNSLYSHLKSDTKCFDSYSPLA